MCECVHDAKTLALRIGEIKAKRANDALLVVFDNEELDGLGGWGSLIIKGLLA